MVRASSVSVRPAFDMRGGRMQSVGTSVLIVTPRPRHSGLQIRGKGHEPMRNVGDHPRRLARTAAADPVHDIWKSQPGDAGSFPKAFDGAG
jgi:hypothetical protein